MQCPNFYNSDVEISCTLTVHVYKYMSDNINLMMNKNPWVAGVSSLWKPVLHGRLERYCVMFVPLNGCDLVLLWVSFQSEGFYSVNTLVAYSYVPPVHRIESLTLEN